MKKLAASTAGALMIGSELLSGKISDENLAPLARTLRTLGVRLTRVVTVLDDLDAIATELTALRTSLDIVFTSGGVGPTHDDITIAAVARSFGVGVREDHSYRALLERTYGERCTPVHLSMALVPEGAELFTTPDVTWPALVVGNVWVLPGLPEAFRSKLSIVHAWVQGPMVLHSRAVFLKTDEVDITEHLNAIVKAHPSVEIGSYPKWFDPTYKTKITFDATNQAELDAAVQDLVNRLENDVARIE
jgi:molybdenum cofactor synthesis domain-containing protein